ncbi:MAG: polysaccharide deacetylase family protein [Ruthenibacterium sp.]
MDDIEQKWNRIFWRSLVLCGCLGIIFAEAVYFGWGVPVGCANADLLPQELLAAEASTDTPAPQEKVVYLTFDDGPSSTTELVLDVLKEKGVRATFFVVSADCNQKHLPTLARTVAEGHVVGLHSHSHEYSDIYKSDDAFWNDIDRLRYAIAPYGCGNSMLLRFPGGSTNTVSRRYGGSELMTKLKAEAVEKGYRCFDWNVCGEDAVGNHPDASEIYSNVVRGASGKAVCVVLLHDTAATRNSAAALPQIVEWFQNAGYRFDTLDNQP